MKLDRLIGILTVLQQKGKVTAPYLAEKFEVSRRTVSRDIEAICRAGIPIVTEQGKGGGIYIMEGFSLDTTVFTEEELQSVFTGLKTLDSVSKSPKAALLAEKIGSTVPIADNMLIDLSSFYKDELSDKTELLKKAIKESRRVKFRYYYPKGEEDKIIEPALIVFKWSDWYVFGFCPDRNDFRMYKLHRLWNLEMTDESFIPQEIPAEKLSFTEVAADNIRVAAVYDESEKFRLIEEYGPYSFSVREDGGLLAEYGFRSERSALEWFLSFGSKVKIISPDSFRDLFIKEIERIAKIYENT